MEFKKLYQTNGKQCEVTINFHDNTLDEVQIRTGDHVLIHKYNADALLECLYNGHSMTIDRKVITDNVAETRYRDGLIQVAGDMEFRGDLQFQSNSGTPESFNVYYKGVYMGNLNKHNNQIRKDFFQITSGRDGVSIEETNRDANTLFFLLGFAKDRTFPYNQIVNLPGLCLHEFIRAMSDMFVAGIYVTYMDQLFGSMIRDVVWDLSEVNGAYTVTAKLYNCYMKMESSDQESEYSLLDGQQVFHDSSMSSNSWHGEVLDLKQIYG